jgi:hypothetical protein
VNVPAWSVPKMGQRLSSFQNNLAGQVSARIQFQNLIIPILLIINILENLHLKLARLKHWQGSNSTKIDMTLIIFITTCLLIYAASELKTAFQKEETY